MAEPLPPCLVAEQRAIAKRTAPPKRADSVTYSRRRSGVTLEPTDDTFLLRGWPVTQRAPAATNAKHIRTTLVRLRVVPDESGTRTKSKLGLAVSNALFAEATLMFPRPCS